MVLHRVKSSFAKCTMTYLFLVVISINAFSSSIVVYTPPPSCLWSFSLVNSACSCLIRCSRNVSRVSDSSSSAISASSSSESAAVRCASRIEATRLSMLDDIVEWWGSYFRVCGGVVLVCGCGEKYARNAAPIICHRDCAELGRLTASWPSLWKAVTDLSARVWITRSLRVKSYEIMCLTSKETVGCGTETSLSSGSQEQFGEQVCR